MTNRRVSRTQWWSLIRLSRVSSRSKIGFKQRRFTKFCFSKFKDLDSSFRRCNDSSKRFSTLVMKSHEVLSHQLTMQNQFQAEKIHQILFQQVEGPSLSLLKVQWFVEAVQKLGDEISWSSPASAHKGKSISSREDSPDSVSASWGTLTHPFEGAMIRRSGSATWWWSFISFSRISLQSQINFKQRRFTKFCFSKLRYLHSAYWRCNDSSKRFSNSVMSSHEVSPHQLTK